MKKHSFNKRSRTIASLLMLVIAAGALLSGANPLHAVGGAVIMFAPIALVARIESKGLTLDANLKSFLAELESAISDEVAKSLKGYVNAEGVQKALEEFQAKMGHTLDDEQKKQLEDTIEAVKNQATTIQQLKDAGISAPGGKSLKALLDENVTKFADLRKAKAGGIDINLKAAGVSSIANVTSTDPASITNPFSPMPTETGPDVIAVRRNPNFILNYVDVGSTSSAVMVWTEEGNSEGDAAITAEGALKPLQDKKFVKRMTEAKKVAGHIIITEEMEKDTPRLATAIRRLFQDNVSRKYDDAVYADLVAVAPGYTLTALDDQIDAADDYAAIGAAIAQIESLNGMPDLIALNPSDKWRMKLQKGSDGHYIAAPFEVNGTTYDGIRVVISNKVTAGNFLVGESKTYKVDELEGYSLRIGWQNDDFVKNQFTAVGEVRFHSYIATNDLVAWCYASFATVKAAIEKP